MSQRRAPATFALSAKEREVAERTERRLAYLKEQTREAELIEKGALRGKPGVIYNALQEQGLYTADPKLDADVKRTRDAEDLLKLVKEFEVGPTGDWHITLPQPAIEAVNQGRFCVECFDRPPTENAEWEARMAKLEGVIGPRPGWATRETCCCYCGNRLGIHGDYTPPPLTPDMMTDDQLKLIAEMFGPNPFANKTYTTGA